MLINILQILACYWNMPNTCLRTKILQKCNGDMNSNLIKSCKFLFYQMRKILQFTESFVVPNSAARRPPRRAAHRAARPRAPVHVLKLHGRRAEAVPGRRAATASQAFARVSYRAALSRTVSPSLPPIT